MSKMHLPSPVPLALAVAIAASTGCATDYDLRYLSSLDAETDGVVLSDDGIDAYAAMSTTTCEIDTTWGCPTSDVDLPTDGERVVDHWHGQTLGATEMGVHVIEGQIWQQPFDLELAGVREARLTSVGTLVLAGDANDCVLTGESDVSVPLPGALCGDQVTTAVDRSAGVLYAGTEDGAWRIGFDGAERIADEGALVAVDGGSGTVVVAMPGGTELMAVSSVGQSLWTVSVPGGIASIALRGGGLAGSAGLLVLHEEDGLGTITRVDVESGEVDDTYAVPSVDGQIVVSDNGQTVGIVHDAVVHWYELLLDGEQAAIDEDVPNCMEPGGFATD